MMIMMKLLTLLLLLLQKSLGVRMKQVVHGRDREGDVNCFYEDLEEDEWITISTMLHEYPDNSHSAHLQAWLVMDGPVVPDVSLVKEGHIGKAMHKSFRDWESGKLNDSVERLVEQHLDYSSEEGLESMGVTDESGGVFEITVQAEHAGWYHICLEPSVEWARQGGLMYAEFETRKSSELGPPDAKTGHIISYEIHDQLNLDRYLNEKEHEEFVNITEFEKIREYVQRIQLHFRGTLHHTDLLYNSMVSHMVASDLAHYKMVTRSVIETLCFIFISCVQVLIVRSWFSSKTGAGGSRGAGGGMLGGYNTNNSSYSYGDI